MIHRHDGRVIFVNPGILVIHVYDFCFSHALMCCPRYWRVTNIEVCLTVRVRISRTRGFRRYRQFLWRIRFVWFANTNPLQDICNIGCKIRIVSYIVTFVIYSFPCDMARFRRADVCCIIRTGKTRRIAFICGLCPRIDDAQRI